MRSTVTCLGALLFLSCVDGGGPSPSDSPLDTGVEEHDAPSLIEGDLDGDGVPAPADCDDANANVSPTSVEDCLTLDVDEDCDTFGGADDPDCDADVDEDVDEDSDEDSDEGEG